MTSLGRRFVTYFASAGPFQPIPSLGALGCCGPCRDDYDPATPTKGEFNGRSFKYQLCQAASPTLLNCPSRRCDAFRRR